MNVGIYYFRSLFSQSACSLSSGKLSDYLTNKGYITNIGLLKIDDFSWNAKYLNQIKKNNIIIYKTNYKDFEYGVRFFENIKNLYPNKKIFLTGPFSNLNEKEIKRKYKYIDGIFDIQNKNDIDMYLNEEQKLNNKPTIIYGIDRELEFMEKGSYINLEASVGCIYNCAFCHINILKYPKEEIEVEKLVDEIDFLVNKMNKKYLIFNDSVFWKGTIDNDRIYKIIKLIKRKQIKFYFMIYLSLSVKIPNELLDELISIGLVRVFFGVENISEDFQKNNNKYISSEKSLKFMELLKNKNVTYHIGFILFSPETIYNDLLLNIKFIYNIKKLIRPGMLVEKMRILPNSKKANMLKYSKLKIDQAYNYSFMDNKVEKCYNLLFEFYNKINIRYFEHFFTSIDLAIGILKREKKDKYYENEIKNYYKVLNNVNEVLYKIIDKMFKTFKYNEEDVVSLFDLYSLAEVNYINFVNKLKENDNYIYLMLPHGKEDLNV
ncbi:MAG: radical SAM protein [Firmicutes bacterium]|nr:radical SAM protein [Bacillota bacterium]